MLCAMADLTLRPRPSPSPALFKPLADARELTLRRARDRSDWERVRALRFGVLRSRGDIPDNPERSHADAHDAALNAITFVLAHRGEVLGCTRSSVRSGGRRWPLPGEAAFAREIDESLGAESTIVEASLTVVEPSSELEPKLALIHLLKAHMLHCSVENADWLIAAVRDSQIGFYRRMFSMEILSGAESYPGLAAPRVLMGLDYRRQAPMLVKRIPALAVTAAEEAAFENVAWT